jgi:5-methylcytosine-specific restriction protein B
MSRFNPHAPHADEVFDAAEQFKQRCLLDQRSLLLGDQLLWTTPHLEALIKHYVDQPDPGEGSFYDKLERLLAACEPLDVALMTEIFWIVQLAPINLRAPTKLRTLDRIWSMKPAARFPTASPFLDKDVLSGLGSAGPGYNQYLPLEMSFAVQAFADLMARPREQRESLLADPWKFAAWLNGIPAGKGRQLYHTLCHVLFPDTFERIFSRGNKIKVARKHRIWQPSLVDDRPALDAALLELRQRLEVQYPGQVDHYKRPVGTLISAPKPPQEPGDVPLAATDSAVDDVDENEAMVLGDEAGPPTAPVLRQTDNLILYGPPGTGKTYEMQQRMQAAYDRGEEFEFVSFHPSYSYEDFVGGLRPIAAPSGQGVVVDFCKGPFLRLCEKAHASPSEQFTLFIDEINRANVAKVFGELITLIEPSKRVIAGSQPNDNGAWVMLPGLGERLGVPDNLHIVATMNTADRSIAMMDVALRRRFRFQECPPEPERIEPAWVGAIELPRLLQCLNDRLEYLLDRDHAIGHAMFMNIGSLQDLQQVLAQRVIPLLQEYFFEDMEKVRLVLTGSHKDSVFFKSRQLSPAQLFPGASSSLGGQAQLSFRVGAPETWTEAHIMSLYGAQSPEKLAGLPEVPALSDEA